MPSVTPTTPNSVPTWSRRCATRRTGCRRCSPACRSIAASGPNPLQPVDVAALLARTGAGRAITRRIDTGAFALAQPGRLETVLAHLVANAAEASAPGQPITLSATLVDDRLAIAVTDCGHGMSPGFVRDQLFRPFASTKPGGFGLGAFEARQSIEAMGGRVDVSSREGEGTCFTLSLPLAPALQVAA